MHEAHDLAEDRQLAVAGVAEDAAEQRADGDVRDEGGRDEGDDEARTRAHDDEDSTAPGGRSGALQPVARVLGPALVPHLEVEARPLARAVAGRADDVPRGHRLALDDTAPRRAARRASGACRRGRSRRGARSRGSGRRTPPCPRGRRAPVSPAPPRSRGRCGSCRCRSAGASGGRRRRALAPRPATAGCRGRRPWGRTPSRRRRPARRASAAAGPRPATARRRTPAFVSFLSTSEVRSSVLRARCWSRLRRAARSRPRSSIDSLVRCSRAVFSAASAPRSRRNAATRALSLRASVLTNR